jgi:hypothetical protein
MPTIAALTSFTANTQAKAAEVNANFSTIRTTVNTYGAFIDQIATITAVWTYNATPVLTTGLSVTAGGIAVTAGGLTVSAGGATVTGNSTIAGTLGGLTGLTVASGGAAITGNSTVTGNLTVTGTVSPGAIAVPAASVTAGTFGAGSYTFPASVTVTTNLTATGGTTTTGVLNATRLKATRSTVSNAGGTLSFAAANHHRITMTGNGTITLSGGETGGVYTVEVLQDGTGSRTVSWSSNIEWPSAATPTSTTTANRKDVFTFFYDGSKYLGQTFGQNYASTG